MTESFDPPDDDKGPIPFAPPVSDAEIQQGAQRAWLAPYGRRVGGYLLDGLILIPVAIVVRLLVGTHHQGSGGVFVTTMVPALVGVGYAWAMLTYAGSQTLGMKAVKVRCVEATSGSPVSSGRSLGRAAAAFVFVSLGGIILIPLLLDLLWPLWDKRNQTLHDKVAGTFVVDTEASEPRSVTFS
jgi:uncharacterized RDD family membrane protein YckC